MSFLYVSSWLKSGILRETASLVLDSVRIPMVKVEAHLLPVQFLGWQEPHSRSVFE